MRPILHSDKVRVLIFTKLPDIDEDQLRSSTSSTNSDDDEEQDIAHEAILAEFRCIFSLN